MKLKKKLSNFNENAYASKFIANISQILYKDYTNSFFSSFIKGIFKPEKKNQFNLCLFVYLICIDLKSKIYQNIF